MEHPDSHIRLQTNFPLEAIVWIAGLLILALTDPTAQLPVFCPLHRLGFDFCPGCGLGRSVSLLLHGDIAGSFRMHPLGLVAAPILTGRVIVLLRSRLKRLPTPSLNHLSKG